MGENSRIEWTDHTFNCWIGCAKVSTGCANCYAERDFGIRRGMATWGPNGTRLITSDNNWKQPLRWNRKAAEEPFVCRKCGTPYFCASGGSPRCDWKCEIVPKRPRVFCGSLCDWLEDRPELDAPLARLLLTIHATPNLQWLLLTKRPELFAARMVAALHADELAGALAVQWAHGSPMPQASIGASVENQAVVQRIEDLIRIPAGRRFLSCEPMLGPLDLRDFLAWQCGDCAAAEERGILCGPCAGTGRVNRGIHWVIAGGESGPRARPSHPIWFESLREQCQAAKVPFFFKQWGEWEPMVNADDYCRFMAQEKEDKGLKSMAKNVAIVYHDGRVVHAEPQRAWWKKMLDQVWEDQLAKPEEPCPVAMHRVGRKVAGCTLSDGECKEVPAWN
jgi:protein gp37